MKKITILSLLLLTIMALTLTSCAMQPPIVTVSPSTATPAPAAQAQPETAGDIVGSWQWTGFRDPANGPATIDAPERYALTLGEDGSVQVKADCNNAQGTYSIEDIAIKIELGPTTLVHCGDDSRSDDFLKYLGFAADYHVDDNKLLIDLKADGGTMTFQRAAERGSGESGGPEAALPAELVESLDALLQENIYNDGADPEATAPGLILLVDTPQGRYLKAAGVANMDDQTPMKEDDILEIGSITKPFTIVLLMQLQEEGVLALDDPLSKWLPDWATKIPYGDEITLRQLANHTSGVWDYGDPILDAGIEDKELLEKHFTPEELVQYAIDNGQPDFKPGEAGQWHYSNTGYILLGMVIEKAADKSLGDLYQERILTPLNMTTAAFIDDIPTEEQITARGYVIDDNGNALDATDWNASQGWAAGALAMNAADLLTFAHAFASGELFQSPDTLQTILDFNPDAEIPYGLGVMDFSIAEDGEGFFGHPGDTAGFSALMATNPDAGVTIVGLANNKVFTVTDLLDALTLLNQGD